jgi:glyoxalase family protein
MRVTGLHHTSHITADAVANNMFYTRVMGLRRTWKTVNFDEPSMIHLAYGDRRMTPGTNLTFFERAGGRAASAGRGSISETALRVGSAQSLDWWAARLQSFGRELVTGLRRGGRPALAFKDPEGLPLLIVADDDAGDERVAWERSPVPPEHQLHGLDSVTLTVAEAQPTAAVLQGVLHLHPLHAAANTDATAVYAIGEGGPGREVHVREQRDAQPYRQGAGGTHHVAFAAPTPDDVDRFAAFVRDAGLPSSGVIDRTFFHNLYFREPGGTLIEIAAEVPGRSPYASDDEIGELVVLPDHLEPQRDAIEATLQRLDG